MRSIALANQKGGVGKTTTAIHLAHGLALRGQKVVLVDLDPQGNAAVALQGMYEEGTEHDGGLRPIVPGLWILAPHLDGDRAPDAAFLAKVDQQVEAAEADWLIADCPPRMDEWGRVGLHICEQVVVPVQAEFLAMHGLSQIMATIDATQGACRLAGVLSTMVDWSEQICREVVANLRSHLGSTVFETVILRDASLVEAASHGKSVFVHSPCSKAALCYGEFIREVCGG